MSSIVYDGSQFMYENWINGSYAIARIKGFNHDLGGSEVFIEVLGSDGTWTHPFPVPVEVIYDDKGQLLTASSLTLDPDQALLG